ncbi:MAG: hypothetical protein KDB03_23950 [Planctomycetales bacterium]|nr:hypothetical protein [Planctomycetales bacterium]
MNVVRFRGLCLALIICCWSWSYGFSQTIPFFITGSGYVPGGYFSLTPFVPIDHNTESGWGIKIGHHTGEGGFQLTAPPNMSTLSVDFSSSRPYHFVSSDDPRNVLACNYGVITGDLPASQPGTATFHSIDSGADPDSPLDDTFIISFLAEFRPALDDCSGKFHKSRLKNGSFMMLALSKPVKIDLANGIVVNANTPGAPIAYSWYGLGTLTFKWPFGLF